MKRSGNSATVSITRCEGKDCRGTGADGLLLCSGCRYLLMVRIEGLPRLYEECEGVLAGGRVNALGERRSAGGTAPGFPFNAAAAEARASILTVLGSWSGLVAQERRVPPPGRALGPMTDFLLRHLDWLAAHPAAGDATREMARLVGGARRVLNPDPVRRVRLGACVEPGCQGTLCASFRDRRSAGDAEVRCDADPAHSWAGEQWTALRRTMGGPRPERWLRAADISRLWNAPVGTVYRLASEQQWRRRSESGRTYYAEADVRLWFDRPEAS